MMWDFESGEILLFDKPYGWSSFDVVNKVRYIIRHICKIRKIKIGHAGTLDPLASGLLILCTGKYTRRIEEIQSLKKTYIGTFLMGETTPSFDKETPTDNTFPTEHITENLVYQVAQEFLGKQLQEPPLFSAIKIEGRRAYKYARKNTEIILPSREIDIHEFEITRIQLPEIDFKVVCSKGTYIRSLARDFGRKLNSGAHLSHLRRTNIGDYSVENAFTPDSFLLNLQQQFLKENHSI